MRSERIRITCRNDESRFSVLSAQMIIRRLGAQCYLSRSGHRSVALKLLRNQTIPVFDTRRLALEDHFLGYKDPYRMASPFLLLQIWECL